MLGKHILAMIFNEIKCHTNTSLGLVGGCIPPVSTPGRDHVIIACSRHIYMGVILRAHPVRGESHIQRNANREDATTCPPFYNEPHRSQVLSVKVAPGATFTSWSQHHLAAIGKPEWQFRFVATSGVSDSTMINKALRNICSVISQPYFRKCQ